MIDPISALEGLEKAVSLVKKAQKVANDIGGLSVMVGRLFDAESQATKSMLAAKKSGGKSNFEIAMRIENAYSRDSAGYDWPVEIINAKDWNDVGYKATEAKPERVYFIPQETTAKVIFECEPNAAKTFARARVAPNRNSASPN